MKKPFLRPLAAPGDFAHHIAGERYSVRLDVGLAMIVGGFADVVEAEREELDQIEAVINAAKE